MGCAPVKCVAEAVAVERQAGLQVGNRDLQAVDLAEEGRHRRVVHDALLPVGRGIRRRMGVPAARERLIPVSIS